MNMPPYPHLLITSIALILLIFLHLHHTQKPPPQDHHPLSPQEGKFSFQEKTRLGSTPPSCHNKCNGCHPCMAVRVPTAPGRKGAARNDIVDEEPSSSSPTTSNSMEYIDPSPAAGKYSNYKPVGWKCRCGSHFYNP